MSRTIREELKTAFEKSGMTYEQFGKRAGVSKSTAHKKLNGEAPIDSGTELELFAQILGLKINVKGAA